VEDGQMQVAMQQAKMPYETVFRASLAIENGVETTSWLKNENGFQLDGRDLDAKAKAVYLSLTHIPEHTRPTPTSYA
ncbi:hypothetical protein CR083_28115, partial [Salmonella enterica subsp. enterica serovar Typhimurium]|uniref:hypothetical protein n=1 Tax=Salmonella enterica TaxID=28901 RepID=UPI000C028CEE